MASYIAKRLFSRTTVRLDTLALVEGVSNGISPASLSTITAATQIGEPVTAIVFGSNGDSVAEAVAKTEGVSKVLVAKDSEYDHYLAEKVSPLLKKIIEDQKFTHFLTAGSSIGKSILPRLGALLDVQPVSEIVKVVDPTTFVRPIYAGNALATVKSKDSIILASVRASAFPPAEIGGATAPVEQVTESVEFGNSAQFVSEQIVKSERPELGLATRVVSGGAWVEK